MNAALLLDNYARIADAPDAVVRLRRFVLDLAVRGKLVEQDGVGGFTDDPEAPFAIPSNWRWRRIGDELELLNGMAFKPTDWVPSGLPIVRIQNLNNDLSPFNFCDPSKARDRSLIEDGTFLISWSGTPGTSFGAFIWQRGKAVLNQHIFRCDFKTANFDAAFLRLAINGRLDEMIAKAHGGVGLQHITKGKLEAMLIALPPLAEQHRIVAKVDELMALCDQLEAARTGREAARDTFTLSTLAKLNTPDPETFGEDARFALANLSPLTARADQVKKLRQTILNLAVCGKLVEQDAEEEPALDYLSHLPDVPAKTRKLQHAVQLDDDCFRLPVSWAWAPLGGLIWGMDAGWSPQCENHPRSDESQWGVLKTTSVQALSFDPAQHKQLPKKLLPRPGMQAELGDILVTRAGPKNRVGVSCVVDTACQRLMISDKLIRFHALGDLSARYLALTLNAGHTLRQIEAAKSGMAVMQMNISQDKLRAVLIPLPPLAEQHRIVAKVDELMALCDQLEASLSSGEHVRTRLLESVLHHVLKRV